MIRRPERMFRWLLALGFFAPVSSTVGQQAELASRGPRFILAGSVLEQDASAAPVLRRRVTLDLNSVTLDHALREITRQAGLEISYSPRVVSLDRFVSLHAREITVAAALTEVLLDATVDVSVTSSGQLALVRSARTLALADTGAVTGRVTDRRNGAPLVGATVVVDGGRQSAATGADGRYRLAGLVAGTYTVRARYIGYTPASTAVAVRAGDDATADFALAPSAQELEQVVVTGTVVPTEVKALPSPVSLIEEGDIARQRPRTLQQLFRQVVPTAVSWDIPAVPAQTAFSVRGATTLSPGNGQMKVLVDGIETAWATYAAVDPSSVERIEVIRGPQAATIYGSDAIGGVIQVFTKRGDPSLARPQLDAQAALGVVQTPYAGYGGVLRQSYAASLRGGVADVGYNVGAGYSRTADYIPGGEHSEQSNPSLYGGMRFARGILSLDLSGRYYVQNNPAVFNPDLSQTGFVYWSKPLHEPAQYQNQALGGRITVAPRVWWRSTLTASFDRFTQDIAQSERRLTTPADTLLEIFNQSRTKAFIGLSTSLQGSRGHALSGSLTAGFDHYSLPITQFFTSGALNTTGSVRTDPAQPVSANRSVTNNTGYFAQAQLGFFDAVFLTGGVRAEQNTNFGDSLGTPISPRAGLSFVQRVATGTTLKLRGSYGRAIRAPSPGQKFAFVSSSNVLLANPRLGPERQKGWDAGMDVAFGSSGSLSLTYYDQTADDLIQLVQVQAVPLPTNQYQNVGRVKNTGVEVEGAVYLGLLELKGQYGYARSRIDKLAPNYSGDLRVGDQTLGTPKHTAGASLAFGPLGGTNIAAGVTYVGSWTLYDFLAEYRCFGGTGPCQPTFRDYIVAYPGFVRASLTVSQQVTPLLSGFLSVDNLTNNRAHELANSAPAIGRISTVGFRLRY